jgi:hypothetical protein
MAEINVASPRSIVDFHGASVVFAFIVGFKKRNHGACNGQGHLKLLNPTCTQICQCATDRAKKHLQKVGRSEFEAESRAAFPPVVIQVKRGP